MTAVTPTITRRRGERAFFVKQQLKAKPNKASAALPRATLKIYRDGSVIKHELQTAEDIIRHKDEAGLRWFNIDGSHQQHALVAAIGEAFGFHELAMEDVRNRNQRAKLDRFDDGTASPHLFVVARIPDAGDPGETEQISIFFRENLVVTIQESPGGDCLSQARENCARAVKTGSLSASLLAAEIIDAAVMDYMAHLPGPEEVIEALSEQIGSGSTDDLVHKFHRFRIEALHLLRDLRPLEDVLRELSGPSDDSLITPRARAKFKDGLDHQRRAVDTLNHLAEEAKELMNLTLAMASHKMNEVMQVLTIVSALLIPPTLIAGVYGMNFEHMPELRWQFGYIGAVVAMFAVSSFQVWLFVRNGWWINPFRMRRDREKRLRASDTAHRSP